MLRNTARRLLLCLALPLTGAACNSSSLVTGPPDIDVAPAAVLFAFPMPGATDGKAVELRNTGDSLLTIAGISLSPDSDPAFSAAFDSGAVELHPDELLVVQITFAPSELRIHEGRLLVLSDDPDEHLVEVPIESTEPVPDIAAEPNPLDFGPVPVGQPATRQVLVSNAGNYPLAIDSIAVEPGTSAFFTVIPPALPLSLSPAASVSFEVTFTPGSAGLHAGAVAIGSNDPDEDPLVIALGGEGIEPDIAVSPLALDFGTVEIGFCNSLAFDVANEGTDDLAVSAVTPSNPVFAAAPGAFTVTPGASSAVTAQFCPTATGPWSGTLAIASNDPDENPVLVAVSGNGIAIPDIDVAPASLAFGNVEITTCAPLPLTVSNTGTATLSVTGVSSDNALFTAAPSVFNVAPGAFVMVTVQFCPGVTGPEAGTLTIASNDPDENPVLVALSGNGVAIPDIDVAPASLSFGSVEIGTCASLPLTVSNTGTGLLSVTGISSSNPVFSAAPMSFSTAPGAATTVSVQFCPGVTGMQSGTLSIASNDPDENPVMVPISGNGIAIPDIDVAPVSLAFGDVEITTCESLPLTVSNTGTGTLTVTGISSSNPVFTAAPGSFSVAPGASSTVTVQFCPSVTGPQTGTLSIASNDPDENPVLVAVSGNGIAIPDIDVAPASLSFGNVEITMCAPLPLTVSNTGTATLSVTGVSSDNAAFTAAPSVFNVAPGASANVTVQFCPGVTGPQSGTLTIASNDPDENPVLVLVSGNGTAIPDIDVAPASLSFGSVEITTCSSLPLTVSNTGTGTLSVTGISSSNPVFSAAPVSFSVAPGASTAVTVQFCPGATGPQSGTLSIASNDPDENPVMVPVSGNGIAIPDIDVAPTSLSFGDVEITTCASLPLAVSNTGTGTLNVTGISSSSPVFTAAPGSFSVAPGASATVTVQLCPSVTGPQSGTLSIASNDPDENPVLVAVSGNGIAIPDIAVAPASLSFGDVANGTCKPLTLTVSNTGTATLAVSGISSSNSLFTASPAVFNVAPGASTPVTVQFCPTASGAQSGTLSIASNDPDENPTLVPVSGNGVAPAPDITVSPMSLAFGDVERFTCSSLSLDVGNVGAGDLLVSSVTPSVSDYSAGPVSFTVVPGGTTSVTVTFCPMDLGPYPATLSITSNDPDENPVLVSLTGNGVPPPVSSTDVALKLTWARNGVDVDLHWLRPGGAFNSTTTDCFWYNCTPSATVTHPDWGVSADPTDDPYLDLDDTNGLGPENMNQINPETGSFKAVVYYFDDFSPPPQNLKTNATLEVYVNGTLVRTFTKEIGDKEKWEVCWVHWNAGTGTGTVEQITTSGVTVSATAMTEDEDVLMNAREAEPESAFADESLDTAIPAKSEVLAADLDARKDAEHGGCSVGPVQSRSWTAMTIVLLALTPALLRRRRN